MMLLKVVHVSVNLSAAARSARQILALSCHFLFRFLALLVVFSFVIVLRIVIEALTQYFFIMI